MTCNVQGWAGQLRVVAITDRLTRTPIIIRTSPPGAAVPFAVDFAVNTEGIWNNEGLNSTRVRSLVNISDVTISILDEQLAVPEPVRRARARARARYSQLRLYTTSRTEKKMKR